MPPLDKITPKQYYKAFGYLGAAAAALAALPFLSKLLPNALEGYGFPPLGDFGYFGRPATAALVLAATYVVYLCRNFPERSRNKAAVLLWILAFAACACYLAATIRFVRSVSINTGNQSTETVTVSVGYHRTDFAKLQGAGSDYDLLRDRGLQEEEIQRLWTFWSLFWARLALWASHCAASSAFAAVFGLGALQQAERQP